MMKNTTYMFELLPRQYQSWLEVHVGGSAEGNVDKEVSVFRIDDGV